jgi:hypothetical protein
MKKFITYKCTNCKRTTDLAINNLQPFIDKCTITNQCLGKLKPIKIKSTRNILPSVNNNVQDWIPRNSELVTKTELQTQKFYSIDCSIDNKIVIASKKDAPFTITFSIQKEVNSNYKEYTYELNQGSLSISGKDNSNTSQILKFSTDDDVYVYLNGKLLVDTIDYTKVFLNNEGYLISLVSPNVGKSIVKIIVEKSSSLIEAEPITFIKNSDLNYDSGNAWSNIETVVINDEQYNLFVCSDINSLPANYRLNLYSDNNDFILLSKPNFTALDRNYINVIPLSNLRDDSTYLKIEINSTKQILASENCIKNMSIPIVIDQVKDQVNEFLNSSSDINTEIVDMTNKFFIGPY